MKTTHVFTEVPKVILGIFIFLLAITFNSGLVANATSEEGGDSQQPATEDSGASSETDTETEKRDEDTPGSEGDDEASPEEGDEESETATTTLVVPTPQAIQAVTPLGSISGSKYYDTNEDGAFDTDNEDGISDWTIYLYDHSWSFIDSVDTDGDGEYIFEDLTEETYYVCEDLPKGWIQTGPPVDVFHSHLGTVVNNSSSTSAEGSVCYESELVVDSGAMNANFLDFGNIEEEEEPTCVVAGYKYDENENPLSGWTIGLRSAHRQLAVRTPGSEGGDAWPYYSAYETIGTDVTDEYGYYCIEEYREEEVYDLMAVYTDYQVFEEMQEGWYVDDVEANHVSQQYDTDDESVFIYIDLPEFGETLWVDFFNEYEGESCLVEGYKYDSGGNPLSGWTIGLSGIGESESESYDGDITTDVTDENGYYCLDAKLKEGSNYSVYEVLQSDWSVYKVMQNGGSSEWIMDGDRASVPVSLYTEETPQIDFYNEFEDSSSSSSGSSQSGSRRSSGKGSVLGTSTGVGEVLGESTGTCEALLSTYMRQGRANDPAQVTILQKFLVEQGFLVMPEGVPFGFFGPLTDAAVGQFQIAYAEDVLKPWEAFGLGNAQTPTGYVFKTTRWKINQIHCPGSEAAPQLP